MSVSQTYYSLETRIRERSDLDRLQAQLALHPLSQRRLHDRAPSGRARLFAAYRADGTLAAVAVGLIAVPVAETFGAGTMLFHDFLALDEQQAVDLIFDAMRHWAKSAGMRTIIGPMSTDLSALRGVRLGHNTLTTSIGLPDNPEYFSRLLERAGFGPVQDLYSFRISTKNNPRVGKLASYVRKKHPEFSIRNFESGSINREIRHVERIYNDAWSGHWGFFPLNESSLLNAFEELRPLFNEKLAFFIMIDGIEQGLGVGIPNPMALDPVNPVNSVRGMLFGVVQRFQKRGVDAVLIDHALATCAANGFDEAEIGWILQSNDRWLAQIRSVFKDQIISENKFRLFVSIV